MFSGEQTFSLEVYKASFVYQFFKNILFHQHKLLILQTYS